LLVEKYIVPPYSYKITKNDCAQIYSVKTILDVSKYNTMALAIEKQILKEKGTLETGILKFDALLIFLKQLVKEKLVNFFSVKTEKKYSLLCDWITYKIIGFEQIMALLIDDNVQEIYLDKPETPIYIDHQKYGRCLTNIYLSEKEISSLKSRICLEKDVVINRLNPSLKAELKTRNFHVRVAIDVPPLASDGICMNIRKLRKKIWSLPELIQNNMLTLEAATYLLFILKRRFNFTIIGEPGSGKTTLANAIDLLTPPDWRKITIEDVIESIEQTQFNKFQTRYSVSPFDSNFSDTSKSKEIIKLLHRSPTWVFLGEIQTSEHSKALFEALSAGLVGIQTCHGRSIEMMILRWTNQHAIPLSSILSLDLIIETSYSLINWKVIRRVNRIVEIAKGALHAGKFINSLNDLKLIDVFKYNVQKNSLTKQIDLYNSPIIKIICEKEGLTKELFEEELVQIKSNLDFLLKNKLYNPQKVIDLLTRRDKFPIIEKLTN